MLLSPGQAQRGFLLRGGLGTLHAAERGAENLERGAGPNRLESSTLAAAATGPARWRSARVPLRESSAIGRVMLTFHHERRR